MKSDYVSTEVRYLYKSRKNVVHGMLISSGLRAQIIQIGLYDMPFKTYRYTIYNMNSNEWSHATATQYFKFLQNALSRRAIRVFRNSKNFIVL